MDDSTPYIVDTEGDLILQLQDNSEARVSSEVLFEASPVFRAMFSRHFKEGQNLRECQKMGKDAYQKLPDDDAEGMLFVCELIHNMDHNLDPSKMTFEVMQKASIIIDKYDCSEFLRPLGQMFDRLMEPWVKKDCLSELMVMSFRFGCARSFVVVTTKLIYDDLQWLHSPNIEGRPGSREYTYRKYSFQHFSHGHDILAKSMRNSRPTSTASSSTQKCSQGAQRQR